MHPAKLDEVLNAKQAKFLECERQDSTFTPVTSVIRKFITHIEDKPTDLIMESPETLSSLFAQNKTRPVRQPLDLITIQILSTSPGSCHHGSHSQRV